MISNEKREEIRARYEASTQGEWNTGIETVVGRVWVYVGGEPLMEPVSTSGWFAELVRKLRCYPIGKIRRGEFVSPLEKRPHYQIPFDEKKELYWKQQEANTKFIAHAHQDIPALLDALDLAESRLSKARETLEVYSNKDKWDNTSFMHKNAFAYEMGYEPAQSCLAEIGGDNA